SAALFIDPQPDFLQEVTANKEADPPKLFLFLLFNHSSGYSLYGEPEESGGDMTALAALLVYFLPTATALIRKRKSTKWIFAVNLLTAWTVIGWVLALVWSFLGKPVAVAKPRSKVADFLVRIFTVGSVLSLFYVLAAPGQRGPRDAKTPG